MSTYDYIHPFIVLLNHVHPGSQEPDVPYVAINLLTMHIAIVLVSFVNFIHFFINGFRLETILRRAEQSALAAASALDLDTDVGSAELSDVPKKAFKVLADTSGYVTRYRLRNLLELATKMDVCVRYNHQIGDYVNRGTVLAYVWDAQTKQHEKNDEEGAAPPNKASMKDCVVQYIPVPEEKIENKTVEEGIEKRLGIFVSRGITLDSKRNSDLDVTLGIQQLSDIAVRALSPGTNDPYTSIQTMDVLTSVLATLAIMELQVPNVLDENGYVRACAPRRTFSYLLSMLDGIRVYGASDISVCRRALRMLGDLAAILTRSKRLHRIPACLAQLEEWMNVSRKNFAKGTSELETLEALNDHILRDIAESEFIKVKDNDEVKDLQDFDTTYNEEESSKEQDVMSTNAVKEFLKKVTYS